MPENGKLLGRFPVSILTTPSDKVIIVGVEAQSLDTLISQAERF